MALQLGEVITPLLRVNFIVEPSGYFGSLESFISATAAAVLPVVATSSMCSFSCPPGMVELPLPSLHGDGVGVAELQSTPIK